MNFVRHQEQAERAGRRLLWLYAFSVIAVVVAVDVVATLLWQLAFGVDAPPPRGFHFTNAAVVLGLVLGGAWLETSRLKEDGALIARRLGAVAVDTVSDPLHRRLQNILEELAIAARIGVPRGFVLEDEPTINALTAGMDRNQAVVVVTRGALSRLTRDELQGVLAHEVSHIVNGDVRLNTRLVGLTFGLEMVALFGRAMLSRMVRRFRDNDLDLLVVVGAVPMLLFGTTFTICGAIGEFAARAIKAGVGRQREFFADAQAVAFTRSRDGLGGALRKIAGTAAALRRESPDMPADRRLDPRRDASLRHPYWQNVGHLMLAGPVSSRKWFATHPSLRQRVHRIFGRHLEPIAAVELVASQRREPELPAIEFAMVARDADADRHGADCASFVAVDGAPVAIAAASHAHHEPKVGRQHPVAGGRSRSCTVSPARDDEQTTQTALPSDPLGHAFAADASRAPARSEGAYDPEAGGDEDAMHADDVGATAPARLVQATREPAGAAALIVALLQESGLPPPRWDDGWSSAAARHPSLAAAVSALPDAALRSLRWPLMELAVARLRPLSLPAREALLASVREMVVADGRVTLREWIYFGLLRLRLAPKRSGARLPVIADPMDARSIRVLFALVAQAAQVSEAKADRAANAAIRALDLVPIGGSAGALSLDALERAVGRAGRLPLLARPQLIAQMVAMLPGDADDEVRDFVRLLCVAIDCPPPSFGPRGASRPRRLATLEAESDARLDAQ
jgi:Zn-dependent protease with chaperone function